jgi:hypothetical protein
MSFSIRKIGMLEMPKIAMLSTKYFLSFRGYPVTTNPENSITFKKYLFLKGGKTMSFPIRKIHLPEMPKIAMLSTYQGIESVRNHLHLGKLQTTFRIPNLLTPHLLILRIQWGCIQSILYAT